MARLAHSGYSSSAYDRPSPTYTTVTHKLSDLTVEILQLLGQGTTTEDLVQRLAKCTDQQLSTLERDLSLFSQHKLTSSDHEAREVLTAIGGIIGSVRESRSPQGILAQKVLEKLGKGTTLAELQTLLESGSSDTLSKLPASLDRMAAGAPEEARGILDGVKELAGTVQEVRTPEGALAEKICLLLAREAPAEDLDEALAKAADGTLRNLPSCLDRAGKRFPESKHGFDPVKEKAAAVLESRSPHAILAREFLDGGGGRKHRQGRLRDTPTGTLTALMPFLDRILPSLEPSQQSLALKIKAEVKALLEKRAPESVLVQKPLAALLDGLPDYRSAPQADPLHALNFVAPPQVSLPPALGTVELGAPTKRGSGPSPLRSALQKALRPSVMTFLGVSLAALGYWASR